jgi:hypothetical protein
MDVCERRHGFGCGDAAMHLRFKCNYVWFAKHRLVDLLDQNMVVRLYRLLALGQLLELARLSLPLRLILGAPPPAL